MVGNLLLETNWVFTFSALSLKEVTASLYL